jgi:hypothetical protein
MRVSLLERYLVINLFSKIIIKVQICALESYTYLQYNAPKTAKSAIVSLLATRYVMGPRILLR